MRVLMWLPAAALLASCATSSRYIYKPAVPVQTGAYPAAEYRIPARDPAGSVEVASFGVNVFRLPSGTTRLAVHVRMTVANQSDERLWSVDPRRVTATFAGQKNAVGPAFLGVDGAPPPATVRIPRGERHIIDLYFPLPQKASGDGAPAGFDVIWQVETGAGEIAGRTLFYRAHVDDGYAYAADGYDGGAYASGHGFGYPMYISPDYGYAFYGGWSQSGYGYSHSWSDPPFTYFGGYGYFGHWPSLGYYGHWPYAGIGHGFSRHGVFTGGHLGIGR